MCVRFWMSLSCLIPVTLAPATCPNVGTVTEVAQIGQFIGGFGSGLQPNDLFGTAVERIGDLDGDGVIDLAVGAQLDDDGGENRGAVWVLFMNADGTVKSKQKISSAHGGFGSGLTDGDQFGVSITNLGDLDGDGVVDLAVGAHLDGDGGPRRGAVWILFLNANGTVKAKQKISSMQGSFGAGLNDRDQFGNSVCALGDLDGDGVPDVAAGAPTDDDGGQDFGAFWILFLNPNGTVKAKQKISSLQGGFGGVLSDTDIFGTAIANLGDLNGDGVVDLAVGANQDDDGAPNSGAIWILFLSSNGTVQSWQKISNTEGGSGGGLNETDFFGTSAVAIGDLDGDGVTDLAVGALFDDDGGQNRGAVWILLLNTDGTVKFKQKISQTSGGFGGSLYNGVNFGRSVANLDTAGENGATRIAVGAFSVDAPLNAGEVWILTLNTCTQTPQITDQPGDVVLAHPGGLAQFSVAASGSGTLEYQWRLDGEDLVNSPSISGVNTPTLTIIATAASVGGYDCVVTNAFGSATSAAAVLAITANPCPPDLNNDGMIDFFDILTYLSQFAAGCP